MNKIEELIINIFNNLQNHFLLILENEKIISVTKNLYEILGYNDFEVIGRDIKDFFPDDSIYFEFKNNLESKEKKNFKIKLKSKSGILKIFDTVLVDFGTQKNLLILKDITGEIKKETLNKILYKISDLTFKVKNLQELFEEIHKLLKEYIYSENFYISLIDESGDYIYFPYFVDLKDEKPTPRKRRGGITEYVLEKEKPILLKKEEILKLREDGKLIFYGTCPEYYIGAPLKVFDKFIGVIALQIYEKNISYTKDDLDLISFISEHISYAIERIRDKEEKLSLIKNIKGFVFTLSYERENVKLINIDGNFEEITGYKKEELLENINKLKSLIYKEDYEKVSKLFSELFELKTKTLTEIFRIITKNGEIKWVSINLSILRIEIPQAKIIQGIVTDITESIKTKEKLFESEMRFKRIFDNSKDIIYRYSLYPKRGFEYVNDIVTEITGYTPEEHYADPDLGLKIVHPDDRGVLQKMISGEVRGPVIFRWIRKDGKIIYTEQNNWFVKDDKENIVAIEGIARDITERKILEESLRESEKKFRILFENAPIGITLTDKNGEIVFCNPKWEEIMGYKFEELKNVKWMDLTYPEDIEEDLEKFNKLIKGELYSYSIEKRAIRKDKKVIWINLKVVRVDDQDGNFLYEIAMIEDITERKILEKSLEESEKRFRTLFEKSPIGITMSDKEGRVFASNEAFLNMIGYSLDEISKVSWREYTHPEDIEKDWENFKKLLNREIDSYTVEKRFIRKDGNIVYGRLNCAAVFDEKGEFQFEFAMIEDITDKKMLEDALLESEKRYRLFFEKNPLGVVIGDFKGNNFINMNEVYLKLVGYTKEELQNLTWKDITHPDDWEKQEELIKKLMNREIDSFEIEKRYIRKDGTIFWGHLFTSAIYDENNNFLYAVGMLRDITEEKELREEIEESRRKLSRSLDNILNLITKLTEMKDPYTLGHQGRVAYLAKKIAEKLNLNEDIIEKIRLASFLHDIGKLTIPTEVLNKGGKLSENEYFLVKEHCKNGYEIIKRVEYLTPIADIVLQHHERLDGSGYPLGLKDDEILLEARVIAVCDVFEAMTSHRPYRPAFSINDTLKELKEKKGILYDSIVVDALEELIINKEIDINFLNGRNKT